MTTPKVGANEVVGDPALENPEIGCEEVVLNRRGMPARQRKKNRYYFDDEIMITSETPRKSGPKSPTKKIKLEPLDDSMSKVVNVETVKEKRGHEVGPKSVRGESSKSPSKSVHRVSSGDRQQQQHHKEHKEQQQDKRPVGRPPLSGKIHLPIKIKKDPDAPQKSSRIESPNKSKTPPTTPQPVRIKRDPDASPSPRTSNKSDREREKNRIMREKQKERESIVKEKEQQKQRRERERQRDKDSEWAPATSSSSSTSTKRNRRSSSPSQYLGNRSATPTELTPEMPKPCIDKKTAQDISIRLRNVLKLPKAHKWVCYEWFYSNVDKVLFEGENDFQICLKESFPTLKARKLARAEWCKIRRMMGKPRRCSQAFFDEEREELGRRRQKIRMIQQRKITDFNYKELPDEIPLQLVIGTKVTARLRRPQDGLFTGQIEGVDTSNNTYRITFDRSGLGTHSIPDYEVLSNDNPETVSTSSFALKIPRRSYGGFTGGNFKLNAALMGDDGVFSTMPKSPFPVDGMLGGFPIRLLDMIVRLSKLLKAKREKILQLKELNVEAEKMCSYSKTVNNDYRMRYARCVLDLDSMNKEMAMYLEGIQQYCLDIAPDHGANQMIIPEHVQDQCRQEALLIVDTYNTKQNRNLLHNQKNLSLIANLTSLLLQIKTLGSGDRNLYELKSIKDTVKEMKASLEGKNVVLFQNRVEIPVNQIQAGLSGSVSHSYKI